MNPYLDKESDAFIEQYKGKIFVLTMSNNIAEVGDLIYRDEKNSNPETDLILLRIRKTAWDMGHYYHVTFAKDWYKLSKDVRTNLMKMLKSDDEDLVNLAIKILSEENKSSYGKTETTEVQGNVETEQNYSVDGVLTAGKKRWKIRIPNNNS